MLSKIERGAASPTIGLLCKITMALGVSITRLVAEPEQARGRLVRPEEMPTLHLDHGVTRTSISTELPEWGIEMVRYVLAPGGTLGKAGGCRAPTQDILHVLDGEIEILLCEDRHRVTAGESFLLEASCGYEIRNGSPTKPATYLSAFDRRPSRTI